MYSYEDAGAACPQEALLDTSFVVEAVIPSQSGHAAAQVYLGRLLVSGTTIYFNRLLELELIETAFRIALKERFGHRDWARRRADGRTRQRAGRLMNEASQAWSSTLRYFNFVQIELDEVAANVPRLMRLYGLASYDAVHAASALYAGVTPIITRDTGFAALPQNALAIYTDASRVASCRRRRGGS